MSAWHRTGFVTGGTGLFPVWDPKVRVIAAAPELDRVVHHAVHDVIEPRLDPMFIHDSYACRYGLHQPAGSFITFHIKP